MMKKIISMLLVITLMVSLTACNNEKKDSTATKSNEVQTDSDAAEVSDEIYEIVMQYPTLGTTPTDLQLVEDAVNAKVESEIGVHVTFYPVSAFDLNSTTNLMVSAGEKLDLMISMFEGGVGSYVNKGILLELDDLVTKYGADIIKAEGNAMSGGYFNGKLYAVPTEEKMGRVKAFTCRKDLLDKYNISYDASHVYTYEELSDIFKTIKLGEADNFYCIAANSSEEKPFYFMDPVDFLGASLASGALMNYGVGSTEVTNYYATDNFKTAASFAHDWYKNGYFSPDCNTTTDSGMTLMQSGNYFGFFSNAEPDMIASQSTQMKAYIGTDLVPLYTSAPSALTQFYQLTLWALPITCDNPEKTMQFLNLLYSDEYLINLIYRGIEGTHWNFSEGSDKVIEYPEGIDPSNTPYISILNVWGDKSKDYVMPPLDESYYKALSDFNASVDAAHTSAALGYCFNSDPVKTEYAAVSDVIKQYEASLGMGVVDPNTVLPEFLDALKAAGIDKVIAENQKQFDEWLAQK